MMPPPAASAHHDQAVAFVAGHCDIEERLAIAPPSANVRGLWFRIIEGQMDELGLGDSYREYFPEPRPSAVRFLWIGDFLVRVAVAGALIAGPEKLQDGIFRLAKSNASMVSRSLLGRTILRLLASEPVRLAQQGNAVTRQTKTYGRWTVRTVGEKCIEIDVQEEYIWIESYFVGAWKGAYDGAGLNADVTAELRDRFNGKVVIRW